ncbi:MAG: glycosyltransferase family 9 protein [Opitutaceae bacterium]
MIPLIRISGWLAARGPTFIPAMTLSLLAHLGFHLFPDRRRRLLANLHHAFPERPKEWHRRTAVHSVRQRLENRLLSIALPYLTERRLRSMIHLPATARTALKRRLDAGEPTVLALPQVGAWGLVAALPLVYPDDRLRLTISCDSQRKTRLQEFRRRGQVRFGVRFLGPEDGLLAGFRTLRENGLHGVLFDQAKVRNSPQTLLMDRLTTLSDLPGALVEHFRAGLVGLYTERISFWHYALRIDEVVTTPAALPASISLNNWLETLLRSSDSACGSWPWDEDYWQRPRSSAQILRLDRSRPLAHAGIDLPRSWRIWVRLPDGLGPALKAVPVIRALRRSRPDAAITLLGRRSLLELLQSSGLAESVIPLPPHRLNLRSLVQSQEAYPDLYLILDQSRRNDTEAWVTGCPVRIGMQDEGETRALLTARWTIPETLDRRRLHETRLLEYFLRHFGLNASRDCTPPIPRVARWPGNPENRPASRLVGLLIGPTDEPSHQWPVEHWRALASRLVRERTGIHIIVMETGRPRRSSDSLARDLPTGRFTHFRGGPESPEFAGALACCDLAIGQNSGTLHLANAMGVPVIGLYGPENPVRTGPVFQAPCRILLPPGSRPTGGRPISGITAEMVLQAVDQSLNRAALTGVAA